MQLSVDNNLNKQTNRSFNEAAFISKYTLEKIRALRYNTLTVTSGSIQTDMQLQPKIKTSANAFESFMRWNSENGVDFKISHHVKHFVISDSTLAFYSYAMVKNSN